ncbi:MAG TPA: glycosyltransferase family 4 protein, partial [Alphaproteobacteria bacterium]|nr:glycosyltransferase family 4 protein [Alphaproteobacteria bacterium]
RRAAADRRRFGREVLALARRLRLRAGDHVLIHTLSLAEADSLVRALALAPDAAGPLFHIVLRRDPDEEYMRRPTHPPLAGLLGRLHGAALWPHRVRCYTDTEALTARYDRIGPVRFATLPIPVRPAAAPAPAPGRPVTLAYLGDARREKGFHLLPDLAAALWEGWLAPGRARLVVQANFNVPGGEPGIAEARARLAALPAGAVELVEAPLGEADYQALLDAADVVLLPYDAAEYRRRSSGVQAEARAAGKVALVPAGTWMAEQAADPAEAFAGPEDFAPAALRVLDDLPRLSAAAAAAAPAWRRRHDPAALVAALLAPPPAADPQRPPLAPDAPAVLYLMDLDSFVYRTGSGQVARNQLEYLARCGYRVYGVLPCMDIASPDLNWDWWRAEGERAVAGLPFAHVWMMPYAMRPATLPSNIRTLRRIARNEYGLERELETRRGFVPPASLRRFLRRARPAAALVNYAPNMALAERLGLRGVPLLCEMHDVQAHQYAIYGRRPVDEAELAREMALLDRAAAVIAINDREAALAAPRLARAQVHYAPQPITARPPALSDLGGCRTFAEVLSAGGSDRPDVDWDAAHHQGRLEQMARLEAARSLDLLFVSTQHAPNIASLDWFLERVFLPHLAPRGVNLTVAGNIHWKYPELRHPQLFWAGRLRDLRPLYAACRLVALPIVAGAGTNIKTLEALAMGKPVVATAMALRGLPPGFAGFPAVDDPDAMAARILELLADPAARRRLGAEGAARFRAHNAFGAYAAAMDGAFADALGAAARPAAAGAPPPEPEFLEWSPEIGLLNVALRHWAEGVPIPPDAAAAIRRRLADPAARARLALLHDALMAARTAPLLESQPGLAAVTARHPDPGLPALLAAVEAAGRPAARAG